MIDFHVHVFPEEFIKKRDKLVERDINFSTIYSNEKAKIVPGSDIISYMDKYSLEKVVAFGFTWLDNALNREHNEYVLELSKRDGRIIPFCTVNVFSNNWETTVLDAMDKGAKGFGEIGYYTGSNNLLREEWKPFMDILKESGKPLLLHVNEPVGHTYPGKADISIKEIYSFIERFRENTIILAHLGGGIFLYAFMKEVKKMLENVFFDTAACPFLYSKEIFKVFSILNQEEKVILGTDYPLLGPSRYKREIEEAMGRDFFKRISEDNPRALLNRI